MQYRFASSLFALVVGCFTVTGLLSGTQAQTAAEPMQHSASVAHGVFMVELLTPLDSRKLKVDDPIQAKLVGGITLPSGAQVPGGTKITGHITQVSSRGRGASESSLGIEFDQIVRSGGEETPIKGTLQAVAPNPDTVSTGGYIDYGPSLRLLTQSQPPETQGSSTPTVNDDSHGVKGFKNMNLDSNGVLTSTGKELKLDAGTRMLLNVTIH